MVHYIGPFNSKVQTSVFPYGGCTHYSCNPPKQGRIDEHDCERPSAPPTRAHAQCSRKVMNQSRSRAQTRLQWERDSSERFKGQ